MQVVMSKYADVVVEEEKLNLDLARAFFQATTKVSNDIEDILPQEGGEEKDYSVFCIFTKLFPEAVGSSGHGTRNKRMRLHFNKLGYQIYGKEQSRRVPSLRAKPGNPGYGFKRARWRDTLQCAEDGLHCERTLRAVGCDQAKIDKVKSCIQEVRWLWHKARRPSRPAGPGRPRGKPSQKTPADTQDGHVEAPDGPTSTLANSPCTGHLSRSTSPPSSTASLLESFAHAATAAWNAAKAPHEAGENFANALALDQTLPNLSILTGKRASDELGTEHTDEKRRRMMLPCPATLFAATPGAGPQFSPPICLLPPPAASGLFFGDRAFDSDARLPLLLPELRLPGV